VGEEKESLNGVELRIGDLEGERRRKGGGLGKKFSGRGNGRASSGKRKKSIKS